MREFAVPAKRWAIFEEISWIVTMSLESESECPQTIRRRPVRSTHLLVCLAGSLTAFLRSQTAQLGAQTGSDNDIAVTKDVMISMRDGVKLATSVYRPARNGAPIDGKFSTILMRTPYNKAERASHLDDYAKARYFVPRGYVVVAQDVRGRYKSERHWWPLRDDANDGFDTTTWIGTQPWSDGSIGTRGTSYEGGTQHALAIANTPYVKEMIPAV